MAIKVGIARVEDESDSREPRVHLLLFPRVDRQREREREKERERERETR